MGEETVDFASALESIKKVLQNIGSDIKEHDYDGIIVKELKASNTLDENRSTNQSHIAITGPQMDMFPYIRADGYFDCDYNKRDESLKQYFVAQIPVYLHRENVNYLDKKADFITEDHHLVHVSIVRSRRDGAADQIQMSMIKIDSVEYVQYRKIVHAGDYMILLKRKKELIYDLYTVKANDDGELLKPLNGQFYKLNERNLKTPVKTDELVNEGNYKYGTYDELKKCNFSTGFHSHFSRNRILFGAPGTGKSSQINKEVNELIANGGAYERVTFHPDYSYANFVGTYKPVPYIRKDGEKGITYEYIPGPFTRVLTKALKNGMSEESTKPYILIVEEINRANMAAVFGDVFQLLDRDASHVSEYSIHTSEDMRKYLAKELGGTEKNYEKIKIPDNMFIWATMNSADQGVFPMDTAFKRRWDFTYLGINNKEKEIANYIITLGVGSYARSVCWNDLRKAINDELLTFNVNEDKLMGTFFISLDVLNTILDDGGEKFRQVFKDKVLMYLFNDAAKRKTTQLFSGCTKSNLYSEIVREFDIKGVSIFDSSIRDQVYSNSDSSNGADKT